MRRPLLFALLLFAAPLYARSLYWDHIAVRARLDSVGTLHFREEQEIVFDGDWNGGERIFRLGRGTNLQLDRVSRLDGGELVPLREGGLDAVDEYSLDGTTLRWRSRLPSDPPFAETHLTYVLEYRIADVLLEKGDRFDLDHQFAFTDRSGDIRQFTLDLALDPAWRAEGFPMHVERKNLLPGEGVVVRASLERVGAGPIETRRSTAPLRLGLAALLFAGALVLWMRFVSRERDLGRFAPLTTATIDRDWIERDLLTIRPEVVGTAWDDTVSSSEIAALLARWTAEGKLKATAEGKEMALQLLVPRTAFSGKERELIDGLFFEGDETSTSAIREHYRSAGFNPAAIVQKELEESASALGPLRERLPKPSIGPAVLLALAGGALIGFGLAGAEVEGPAIAGFVGLAICCVIGIITAVFWRRRVDWGLPHTTMFALPLVAAMGVVTLLLMLDLLPILALAGFTCAALFVTSLVLWLAMSKHGPEAIRFRKRLASVRQYFIDELKKPAPAIDDAWFPWVIAFGLDRHADKWGRAFGSVSSTHHMHGTSYSPGSSSGPSWSGGGGAFGGAGATGAWGAAATGLAAGVASASSGSGGGGGGASGGGGGGGW